MPQYLLLLGVATMLCLLSSARAQDKPASDGADPAAIFTDLDTNKDGQLTADEVPADKKRLFERLLRINDKDGDGKLSRDEFVAGIQRKPEPPAAGPPQEERQRPGPERIFKRLDKNGDGKLTLDEVPEERKPMFKALFEHADKDGDGALSEQEFAEGLRNAPRPPGPPPGNPNPNPGGNPAEAARNAERLFRRLDKNGDGKVTMEEVPAERRKQFERLFRRSDKDHDGNLTLDELSAGMRGGPPAAPPVPGGETQAARVPPPRGGLFALLDSDHDGKLSSAEISAAPEVLKKLDTNGDGTISLDELPPPPAEPAR